MKILHKISKNGEVWLANGRRVSTMYINCPSVALSMNGQSATDQIKGNPDHQRGLDRLIKLGGGDLHWMGVRGGGFGVWVVITKCLSDVIQAGSHTDEDAGRWETKILYINSMLGME